MADFREIADRLGPGQTDPMRSVVFSVRYQGKEELLVGTFQIDISAKIEAMRKKADELVACFIEQHFPDGTPLPVILEIHPGALRWIPDENYYRQPINASGEDG